MPNAVTPLAPGEGRVAAFDEQVGLGEILVADGSVVPFHCIEITDGTRTVDVGCPVTFRVAARRPGTFEAVEIHKTVAEPTR